MNPKLFLLSVLFLFSLHIARAQTKHVSPGKDDVFVYTDLSIGAGTSFRFDARLNFLFLEHHAFSVGYNSFWRRAPNMPSDMYADNFLNLTPFQYPQEFLTGAAFTYAYVLYPHKRPDLIRYMLRAGVLLGNYSDVSNFRPSTGWFGSNYDYDRVDHPTAAFIVEPTFEYTPSRAFGLTAGAYACFNNGLSGVGIKWGIILGKVGHHRHIYHHKQHGAKR